jgi:hypothetical protein
MELAAATTFDLNIDFSVIILEVALTCHRSLADKFNSCADAPFLIPDWPD